jgi:hypothetical protein
VDFDGAYPLDGARAVPQVVMAFLDTLVQPLVYHCPESVPTNPAPPKCLLELHVQTADQVLAVHFSLKLPGSSKVAGGSSGSESIVQCTIDELRRQGGEKSN